MKNLLMAALVFLSSAFSFAKIENSQISNVCRGEFNENIIESVKACSKKDLAQAQVEIYSLEERVVELKQSIEKAEAYVSSPQYEKDKNKDLILTTSVVGGTILGMVIAGIGAKIKNDILYNGGALISILMSIGVGYGTAKANFRFVKFSPRQIPEMKERVNNLLEQVRIRKALIDAANAIKAAQE